MGKTLHANAGDSGDTGVIPGLGCHGGGNDNLLQYSCPGDPLNRRAWWAIVGGLTNNTTEQLSIGTRLNCRKKTVPIQLKSSTRQVVIRRASREQTLPMMGN